LDHDLIGKFKTELLRITGAITSQSTSVMNEALRNQFEESVRMKNLLMNDIETLQQNLDER
jgi:hypothetical protein